MIKISKQDWERFKRDNNPEIFEAKAIDSWIENNRDLLVKAETSELEGIEKEAVDNFRTELSHFTKVEVMGPNPDKLQKGLYCEIFYIREQQVDWDGAIEKSEDGEDYGFGTFRKTVLNDKLGRTGNLIEKGKRGQLGEIREWKGGKVKKTAQGWVPVSEVKKESKEESSEGKDDKKERNLWIADRADKLAKDHPDKTTDQLLRMAGKEWENIETPDVNPPGHVFSESSKRPESDKIITAKELNKVFSNSEDWGDLGDRVSVDGNKLEVVDTYFYRGKDRLSSLKNDWTGPDGWMSKYIKEKYGIKLIVDSEDLQDKASGKYKKFGKNMGVAVLKLRIEKE